MELRCFRVCSRLLGKVRAENRILDGMHKTPPHTWLPCNDLVPRAGRKKGHPEQIGRLEQAEESFVHQAIGLSFEEVSQSFAGLG